MSASDQGRGFGGPGWSRGRSGRLAQLEETVSASTRDAQQAKPLPGDRDQPHRVPPPLLGST